MAWVRLVSTSRASVRRTSVVPGLDLLVRGLGRWGLDPNRHGYSLGRLAHGERCCCCTKDNSSGAQGYQCRRPPRIRDYSHNI